MKNIKKMKLFKLTLPLLALLFLAACGGGNQSQDGSAEEAPVEEPPVPENIQKLRTMDLSSVENIEDWFAEMAIALNENDVPVSPTKMVAIGDQTMEVNVVNPEGEIMIVRAGSPDLGAAMEEGFRYFVRRGDVITLESLQKTETGYRVDRFFYGAGQLLKADSRSGETIEAARSAVPAEYESPYGDSDFRLNYSEVKAASDNFLAAISQG